MSLLVGCRNAGRYYRIYLNHFSSPYCVGGLLRPLCCRNVYNLYRLFWSRSGLLRPVELTALVAVLISSMFFEKRCMCGLCFVAVLSGPIAEVMTGVLDCVQTNSQRHNVQILITAWAFLVRLTNVGRHP